MLSEDDLDCHKNRQRPLSFKQQHQTMTDRTGSQNTVTLCRHHHHFRSRRRPPASSIISDRYELLRRGICVVPLPVNPPPLPPSDTNNHHTATNMRHLETWQSWATELSRVTPEIITSEGDGEYAFYRNILSDPDLPPLDAIWQDPTTSDIAKAIWQFFVGVDTTTTTTASLATTPATTTTTNLRDYLRLDDAFCIHYNMTQQDTSGPKHVDPSDITINLCLEKSPNVQGSQVKFYGRQSLLFASTNQQPNKEKEQALYADNNTNLDDDTGTTAPKLATAAAAPPLMLTSDSTPTAVVAADDDDDDLVEDSDYFLVEQQAGYATIHWGHHPHETIPMTAGGVRTNIVMTLCFLSSVRQSDAMTRSCYTTS